MDSTAERRTGGWWRAAGVVAGCTAVAELLAPRVDLADILMVYLAGVAWVAARERLAISVATVLASIFLFDLVFVPPRWGLNPVDKGHLLTFLIMLALGLLVSRLADRARRQRLLAERQARRAAALADLAGHLAAAATPRDVVRSVQEGVQRTLGLPARLALADAPPAPVAPGASWEVQGTGGPLGRLELLADAQALDAAARELLAAFAHQAAVALERCALGQQVAAAQVEAESERLRSTLLSGISHDFRTPLTTIVGAADSLLEQGGRLDAAQRASLARGVRDEAQRLHRLVSDLLELTRLEEGAVQLAPEWCPADELVHEALRPLQPRLAGHRLEIAADDGIVWCDARLVEQALVNLVDNALQHTPPGTRVRVAIQAQDRHWELVVADDGPGLPPGREQEVLRKFQRGQPEAAGGGTGLGLAICAAVARLHGGTITAANDGGARLVLRLPQPPRPDLPAATA
jgi:two-component system sensor histidine kinase KdpD